jgi:tRNA nucleotidyltransferase/poly(A) polymerase
MSEKSYSSAAGSDQLLDQVVQLLQDMDTPVYLVGGAVRDWLLGAQYGTWPDLDFAVPGDGLSIARRVADALGAAFYPLDAQRGVGRIVLSVDQGPARVVDIARFQGPDLEADLAGRDFTLNAIALDMTQVPRPLIDPYGGQADLEARRLRAVSDHALREDPVRGLRAVRLATKLGFEIEPRTQTLIQNAASSLVSVSAERVRDELVKILSLPDVANSLRVLEMLGLLVEILPEVTVLKGLTQTSPHCWDAYEHTLQTIDALETLLPISDASPHPDVPFPDQVADHLATVVAAGHNRRLLLNLAVSLHDVGKRHTATTEADGRIRFIDHERVGAEMAAHVMHRLRFSGDEVRLVETIVRHHLRPLQLSWQGVPSQPSLPGSSPTCVERGGVGRTDRGAGQGRRAIHRFFRATDDAGVDVALLSLADYRATSDYNADDDQCSERASGYIDLRETVTVLLDTYFNHQQTVVTPKLLLTGRDLIQQFGLKPGPEIGRLLTALREAQAVGQVTSRKQAEAWMERRIKDSRHKM